MNHRETPCALLRVTKFLKIRTLALSICVVAGLFEHQVIRGKPLSSSSGVVSRASSSATLRYRLDASQSNFMVRAFSGGLLWFKGHDHLIRARDFSGEAQLTLGAITPASLHIIVRAASLEETRDVFTPQQKQIINKELQDIVLEPDKYPEIVFKSTSVTGKSIGANQYDLKIIGDLTLHGVTREITIPTTITITGNDLRAKGEFNIERSDFSVKATSAMHGMIRVRDKLKFTFDIVGHQL